jgi:lipoprotein signal peptidase
MRAENGSTKTMNGTTERSYHWLFWSLALIGFCLDQVSKYEVFRQLYLVAEPDQYGQLAGEAELIPGVFRLHAGFTYQKETGSGILATLRTYSSDRLPYVNQGALFGRGHTIFGMNGNIVFAVVSVGAAAAIIYWSRRPHSRRDRFLSLALGLILAGTLGNLYDRIVFHGVRDFLYWYYLIDWPIFNIADCCLVLGASLLLLQAFLTEVPHPAPVESVATAKEAEVVEMKT